MLRSAQGSAFTMKIFVGRAKIPDMSDRLTVVREQMLPQDLQGKRCPRKQEVRLNVARLFISKICSGTG